MMPSKTSSKPSAPRIPSFDDIDSYFLEEDYADGDPLRSPSPFVAREKSREPDALGLDEEVEIKKRAQVPRVKLDEDRLLSDNGVPKLRKRAKHLKLKGKGHEFSDAARLLSFYQLWLDDLFPKAKFLDALAMVEKAGHKTMMHKMRMEWINEGKPKASVEVDDVDIMPGSPARLAPIFDKPFAARPMTPAVADDLFGGEDIYDATPRAECTTIRNAGSGGGEPEEDDLDALMAEAEAEAETRTGRQPNATGITLTKPISSIFGGDGAQAKPPSTSIFGGDGHGVTLQSGSDGREEDDLDALMAETEMGSSVAAKAPSTRTNDVEHAEDDLDALMAEAETGGLVPKVANLGAKDAGHFAEEEEAMAEMDDLW